LRRKCSIEDPVTNISLRQDHEIHHSPIMVAGESDESDVAATTDKDLFGHFVDEDSVDGLRAEYLDDS
jgi:hypothetical protein